VPAGYSGTPLAKKLGVKPHSALALLDAPARWSVPELPIGVRATSARFSASALAEADVAVAFCRTIADVEKLAGSVGVLAGAGSIWVAWPRKAGGHVSDVSENPLRELVLPTGLVDVKVAALDDDWSALKFVWRAGNPRRG
jgi:hypothetical protein